MQDSRVRKGTISELVTSAKLISLGYEVLVGLHPLPYDILIRTQDGFSKLQVKTCRRETPNYLCIACSKRQYDGAHLYQAHEVDFFIGVDHSDFYVIPFASVGKQQNYGVSESDKDRWDLLPAPRT